MSPSVRLVALALLAFVLPTIAPLVEGAPPPASYRIQPGSDLSSPGGGCTLNFVFKDAAGATYVGTAGHCVNRVGDRVRTGGFEWGQAVLDIDGSVDFALLRVDAAFVPYVDPAVRRWGGPTAVTDRDDTETGDGLLVYGYGLAFGLNENTRPRRGVLLGETANHYTADTLAVNGDSGGPLLHAETGTALGIISAYNLPFSTDRGPLLAYALAEAAKRGFEVTLQTAPYVSPEPV